MQQQVRASIPLPGPELTPSDRKTTHWHFSRSACYGNCNLWRLCRRWTGWPMQTNSATTREPINAMFDYSQTIEAFRDKKVRLSSSFADKLLDHRKANRDRLTDRLPDYIDGLTIGE